MTGSFGGADRCFGYPTSCSRSTFSSPGYPSGYFNSYSQLYQLFIATATSITFSFDEPFGVEVEDELYIGTGLTVPTNFQSVPGVQYQFSGTSTPDNFTLTSDTVWILFRTDDVGSSVGWQLRWTASKSINTLAKMLLFLFFCCVHWLAWFKLD